MSFYQVKWVFFDLGYTLINEDEAHKKRVSSAHLAFIEKGQNIDERTIYEAILKSSEKFSSSPFKEAIRMLSSSDDISHYVLEMAKYNKEYEKPYSDAEAILSKLSQKYKIGVIANQSAGTEERLKEYGLFQYVDLCVSSAEVGFAKPDPRIFSFALGETQCHPDQVIMVGDRIDNDIFPAKKLGWRTVRVLRGISKVQEPPTNDYVADYSIENLVQLLDIL